MVLDPTRKVTHVSDRRPFSLQDFGGSVAFESMIPSTWSCDGRLAASSRIDFVEFHISVISGTGYTMALSIISRITSSLLQPDCWSEKVKDGCLFLIGSKWQEWLYG